MPMEHKRAVPLADIHRLAFGDQNTAGTQGTPFRPVQSDLLTRKEAAAYLGVSEQTLAIWKCTKRYGLPVVKIGRLAKYRLADLDAFINSRTVSA